MDDRPYSGWLLVLHRLRRLLKEVHLAHFDRNSSILQEEVVSIQREQTVRVNLEGDNKEAQTEEENSSLQKAVRANMEDNKKDREEEESSSGNV